MEKFVFLNFLYTFAIRNNQYADVAQLARAADL